MTDQSLCRVVSYTMAMHEKIRRPTCYPRPAKAINEKFTTKGCLSFLFFSVSLYHTHQNPIIPFILY